MMYRPFTHLEASSHDTVPGYGPTIETDFEDYSQIGHLKRVVLGGPGSPLPGPPGFQRRGERLGAGLTHLPEEEGGAFLHRRIRVVHQPEDRVDSGFPDLAERHGGERLEVRVALLDDGDERLDRRRPDPRKGSH